MIFILCFIGLVLLIGYLYNKSINNHDFWKKRGVFYIKPIPVIGNLGTIFKLRKQIGIFLIDIYRKYREKPYVGIFLGNNPCLVINDFSIIEDIFANFNNFSIRIFSPPANVDPLGHKSLFALYDEEWKIGRSKLAPGFGNIKLKVMFDDINTVSNKLEKFIHSEKSFQLTDISVRYTVDVISAAIFRKTGTAITDPGDDELLKIAKEMFSSDVITGFKLNCVFLFPKILSMLRMCMFSENSYNYMRVTMKDILKKRGLESTRYNDFIEMLIDQKNAGGWKMNNGKVFDLEGDNLVAQIFMFMTAGYDSTGSVMLFCLYELAIHQDIQDKVRKEIREVILSNNGTFTFECVNQLKYLECVINESLRKRPALPFLDKICTKDYQVPRSNLLITKGTSVLIPMLGLHNDERYWESPERFDPDRFESPDKIKGKPYFPFGAGPRMCIAVKFAMMLLKMGIVGIIKNHRITTKQVQIHLDPMRFSLYPTEDITVHVEPL